MAKIYLVYHYLQDLGPADVWNGRLNAEYFQDDVFFEDEKELVAPYVAHLQARDRDTRYLVIEMEESHRPLMPRLLLCGDGKEDS